MLYPPLSCPVVDSSQYVAVELQGAVTLNHASTPFLRRETVIVSVAIPPLYPLLGFLLDLFGQ
jgi:hypothetical protein